MATTNDVNDDIGKDPFILLYVHDRLIVMSETCPLHFLYQLNQLWPVRMHFLLFTLTMYIHLFPVGSHDCVHTL